MPDLTGTRGGLPAILGASVLLALTACGGPDDGDGVGDDVDAGRDVDSGDPGPDLDVPASSAELFPYLQAGGYLDMAGETVVHAATNGSPHGPVRVFISARLEASLTAGNESHPAGAAAVKELYDNDSTTLIGWAVMVKTAADSAGGSNWYWYENFSTTDNSDPIADGNGVGLCTGCHQAQGNRDLFRSDFPLQ